MANRNDPQKTLHEQDIKNKTPPRRGTDEPWKRPGQLSQNPSEPDPPQIDLEKWREANTS
ncbi:hypothetical protein V1291_005396 [Nitrobacteraceae bacterium AZCC 1564]